MKVLYLSLKKEWYEMIESGVKKEEYREIKPYWVKRFVVPIFGNKLSNGAAEGIVREVNMQSSVSCLKQIKLVGYTHVRFSYGYTKRTMMFEIEQIMIGRGRSEWGAPVELVFIIQLGKRV